MWNDVYDIWSVFGQNPSLLCTEPPNPTNMIYKYI